MESFDTSLSSASASEDPSRWRREEILLSSTGEKNEQEEKEKEKNTALTSSSLTFNSFGDAHTVDATSFLLPFSYEPNDSAWSKSEKESTEMIAPLSLNSHYGFSSSEAGSVVRQEKTTERSSEIEVDRCTQEEKEAKRESKEYLEEEEERARRAERETEIGENFFLEEALHKKKEQEEVLEEEVRELQQRYTEKEHQSLADLYGLESPSDDDTEEEEEGDDLQEASSDSEEEGKQNFSSSRTLLPFNDLTSRRRVTEDGLALHRVRELLRYEGSSTILSKDGVSMVAEAVGLLLQDLTRSAAEMAKRRRKKRVTAKDIAQVISLYDRFSFLAEVVPQPEKEKKDKVSRRPMKAVKHPMNTLPVVDFFGRSTAEIERDARDKVETESREKKSTNTLAGSNSSITVEEDEDNECHTTHRQECEEEEARTSQTQSRSFSFPHPSGPKKTEKSALRF